MGIDTDQGEADGIQGQFDLTLSLYSVPGTGSSAGASGSKSYTYEKVNSLALAGIASHFSEMKDSGWKCGFRLVVGKGSE